MKSFADWVRFLLALAGAQVTVLALCVASISATAPACFSTVDLTSAYRIVLPQAHVATLDAAHTKSYLALYNKLAPASRYGGDQMLVISFNRRANVILIPLDKGIGCQRLIAGPGLHRKIMNAILGKGV